MKWSLRPRSGSIFEYPSKESMVDDWGAKPYLKTTNNLRKLKKAVYNDRQWKNQLHTTYNDNLTEKQCRYLYKKVDERGNHVWRGLLVQRTNFPLDLIREIVLTEKHRFMLKIIAQYPGLDKETKVTAALKLMTTVPTNADEIIDIEHLLEGERRLLSYADINSSL